MTTGDSGGLQRTAGDSEGRWGEVGKARMMSHDAIMFGREVYDFNLG